MDEDYYDSSEDPDLTPNIKGVNIVLKLRDDRSIINRLIELVDDAIESGVDVGARRRKDLDFKRNPDFMWAQKYILSPYYVDETDDDSMPYLKKLKALLIDIANTELCSSCVKNIATLTCLDCNGRKFCSIECHHK